MSKCATEPCPSCPYRLDTPKGVWSLEHYERLPAYDNGILSQMHHGAIAPFGCHYDNGNLCKGWLDCHGADNLLALRISGEITMEMRTPSSIPVYHSGKAVLAANLPHMDNPSPEARELMANLIKIPGKKYADE